MHYYWFPDTKYSPTLTDPHLPENFNGRSCHNGGHHTHTHTRPDPVTAIVFVLKSSAMYSCLYVFDKKNHY